MTSWSERARRRGGHMSGPRRGAVYTASGTVYQRSPRSAILITAGANQDGTLKVHEFRTAAEAQKLFPWAAR